MTSLKEFLVTGDTKNNVAILEDVEMTKECSDNLPNQIEDEQCNTLVET